jgi:peptidoglycan/LPS O-acetylase OafA/YrhL
MTTSSTPTPHLPWLDGLRGAAALAVVLFHISVIAIFYYPPGSGIMAHAGVRGFMRVAQQGILGVPVFFVLSGFCVGQTWLNARSVTHFVLRRWRRIFPAYYASLGLILACVLAAKLLRGVNDITTLPSLTPGYVVATLTLLTAPASNAPTLTWVYWTLTYEVVFYVVLSALLFLPPRARLITLAMLNTTFCVIGTWSNLVHSPGAFFFVSLWPLFGLGLALALAPRHWKTGGVVGIFSGLATLRLISSERYHGFAPAALIAVALVAVCTAGWNLPRWRLLEKLGAISYSLYLIHVPLLLAFGKYLVLRPKQTPGLFFLGVTGAVTLTIAFAAVFHRYFEAPFHQSRDAILAPAAP